MPSSPIIHTREMHIYEVHAREMHACEMHACEMHACDMHACCCGKLSVTSAIRGILGYMYTKAAVREPAPPPYLCGV
jgi:hypothetical protein